MRFLTATSASFARFTRGFRVPLAQQGLVLVTGINRDHGSAFDANAVGKSMLFEAALSWCPYGKLARYGNERVGADEVCFEGRPADVCDEIETSTGTYTISRMRTAKGPRLDVMVRDGDRYVSLRNSALHAAIANDNMIQLLGFDYLTMRSAMILQGSGMDVGGAAFAAQMKVLEAVLRFDVYTDAKTRASDRLKAIQTEERSLVDALASWSHMVESANDTLADLNALDETEREDEITARLAEIKGELAPYDREERPVAYYQTRAQHALMALAKAIHHHDALVNRRERLDALEATCPECEQPVSEKHVQTHLDLLDVDIVAAVAEIETVRADKETCEQELDDAHAWGASRDNLVRERTQLQRELKDLRDRAERRIGIVQAQTQRREEAETRAAETTDAITALRRQVQIATNWTRRDFDALKGATFSAGAPYFDDRAAYYSDVLTGGAIRVRLNPVRTTRGDDLILIDGASAKTYQGCSAGEKRRIDIIVALSLRALARWRMHGETLNVCLYDEVLDPLDDAGVERAMRIVQQDLDASESVFLITHSPRVRALYPNAREWRVIRENGQSRVETD